jgi:hypothetical protein
MRHRERSSYDPQYGTTLELKVPRDVMSRLEYFQRKTGLPMDRIIIDILREGCSKAWPIPQARWLEQEPPSASSAT